MIERYAVPEIEAIFSDAGKFARWTEVELCVVEAMAGLGRVPAEAASACREAAPVIDEDFVERVRLREQTTNHDVAAFVDVLQQSIGMPHGAWVHHGLTSTDVVDTALCWSLRDAADLIVAALDDLVVVVSRLAHDHRNTVMIGRTHGIHAEPTTFGSKVALWGLQLLRDRERIMRARTAVAVCKLSGAVGTYSNIPPEVEADVASRLGLEPTPATQVVARDRHAEYLWACASLGSSLEAIAVELRHLQRTEVDEVREGFAVGQKGSSAMPHKRNPISAETITGLSRVLRSHAQVGLQDVALWHERDISHSSAERIVLPDASSLAVYMVRRMTRLLSGLEVDATRMAANLGMLGGVVFSQSALLALVEAGMSRDEAYRVVQSVARDSLDSGIGFRESFASHPSAAMLPAPALDGVFDMARVTAHAGRAIDALDRRMADQRPG